MRRLLRAATLGSATMGVMLVLYTGASTETLVVTALTAVLYFAWWLAGDSGKNATDANRPAEGT